ncbi:hypothetical protein [Clostridium sp.]|nr:hypothetical protein [Clostridium sp.]
MILELIKQMYVRKLKNYRYILVCVIDDYGESEKRYGVVYV